MDGSQHRPGHSRKRLMMRFVESVFTIAAWLIVGVTAEAAPKTNVVLILIDDLGWNDVGCYGSKY